MQGPVGRGKQTKIDFTGFAYKVRQAREGLSHHWFAGTHGHAAWPNASACPHTNECLAGTGLSITNTFP